ncbi:hypothetical protein LINGRAHAP2_LOCUS7026 [Linum grandiflorum]
MENYYDDELLQFVNPLLNALEAYILQKGTLYAVENLPYPTGTILSLLVKLHQGWEECKGKVADDRGLWDLLKGYVASIVENATTWMTNAAEFVKRLVSGGRKLVEDSVNKVSALISSIKVWFSNLIQRAKKMWRIELQPDLKSRSSGSSRTDPPPPPATECKRNSTSSGRSLLFSGCDCRIGGAIQPAAMVKEEQFRKDSVKEENKQAPTALAAPTKKKKQGRGGKEETGQSWSGS